jgi:hypothetical protein
MAKLKARVSRAQLSDFSKEIWGRLVPFEDNDFVYLFDGYRPSMTTKFVNLKGKVIEPPYADSHCIPWGNYSWRGYKAAPGYGFLWQQGTERLIALPIGNGEEFELTLETSLGSRSIHTALEAMGVTFTVAE